MRPIFRPWFPLLVGLLGVVLPVSGQEKRSADGLQVFYDFREAEGSVVHDRAESGDPLDLQIADPEAVTWQDGALEISGETEIRTSRPAHRLIEAVKRSRGITLEAWIQPANDSQEGPARIVSLSANSSERLFTLGQEKDRYDVRFRTDRTNRNGIPSVGSSGKGAGPRLTHVVYTWRKDGSGRLYLDGRLAGERKLEGGLESWKEPFHLGLGNEMGGGRPWRGRLHLVAIFDRPLSESEIGVHFRAGPDPVTAPKSPLELSGALFEEKIAALLANRCVECHEPGVSEGDLILTRHSASWAEDGLLVPGNADDSLFWERVVTDEMPEDREPLSAEEKRLLKQWIDQGAAWTVAEIDPADYRHGKENPQVWVRRLTVPEYIGTVNATLGVDIAAEAGDLLPRDLRADGFSNTAYNLGVDLDHVDAYAKLAETIVARLDVIEFARRFHPKQNVNDKDMRRLIETMGAWILRGPLVESEIDLFRGITTTVVSSGGDFEEAIAFVIEAMLQSPRFLYRIEKQRGDGNAWPVSSHELASRLSYILWGTSPDEELFRSAESGELDRTAVIEQQARRMLEDPRAIAQSQRFVEDWLHLDRLDQIQPSPEKFPDWDSSLAADMKAETLAYFEEIVWRQQRPLGDLLNAQVGFLTPRLARHYGVRSFPAHSGNEGSDLVRVDLSDEPARGGLLTQGSVLTLGGEDASMVTRGLFVFHDLLRGTVNNPPPDLVVKPVPTKPGLTHRMVSEKRIENQACGACHVKFEPLAFGLEKYDGLGRWRESDEHGNRLREDGEVLVPGREQAVAYRNSAELMDFLAGNDRVAESLTRKLVQFAVGRPLTAADVPVLEAIHERAKADGFTYAGVMVAIVTSDLVRRTRTEEAP